MDKLTENPSNPSANAINIKELKLSIGESACILIIPPCHWLYNLCNEEPFYVVNSLIIFMYLNDAVCRSLYTVEYSISDSVRCDFLCINNIDILYLHLTQIVV